MPKYNHSFEEINGELYEHWTNKSGDEHTMILLKSDDDSGDEGCMACGNPDYPNCKSSCPLCDD